jgi:hypothetical protein
MHQCMGAKHITVANLAVLSIVYILILVALRNLRMNMLELFRPGGRAKINP